MTMKPLASSRPLCGLFNGQAIPATPPGWVKELLLRQRQGVQYMACDKAAVRTSPLKTDWHVKGIVRHDLPRASHDQMSSVAEDDHRVRFDYRLRQRPAIAMEQGLFAFLEENMI